MGRAFHFRSRLSGLVPESHEAQNRQEHANAESAENLPLPKHLDAETIDHIIAGLSDEQVRRLLINELKAQAQQETLVEAEPEGIAGFINR